MSENKMEGTIQIAQKLVNHLPKELDDELKELLQRAENGEDTTRQIIKLLSPHENIRRWMKQQISLQSAEKGSTRGYATLAGDSSVPASSKWICREAGCIESLPVIQEDETAPVCRVHRVDMRRVDPEKG